MESLAFTILDMLTRGQLTSKAIYIAAKLSVVLLDMVDKMMYQHVSSISSMYDFSQCYNNIYSVDKGKDIC
jgi:hypothetical protein